MLHIWKKDKKSSHIYRMSLEVQFDFLSREENVKLYMVMMSLEKIPIIHKRKCSHSVILAIYDNVADTYFAQAREYVPGVGRFAWEDWIKGNIEQPFSLNWYGYCFGNPLLFVDRDGKLAGEVSIRNLPRGLNEKNIRMFLGLSENEVIP